MRMIVLAAVALNLVSCSKDKGKKSNAFQGEVAVAVEQQSADQSADQSPEVKSTLTIEIGRGSGQLGLFDYLDEGAVVTKASLDCAGQPSIALNDGSNIIFERLGGCTVTMTEFKLKDDVYTFSGSSSTRSPDVAIFTSATVPFNDNQKLVKNRYKIDGNGKNLCHENKTCEYYELEIPFIYSEINESDVEIYNDVIITSVVLDADLELAPVCKVSAKFKQGVGFNTPPTFEVVLTDCTHLDGSALEFALVKHAQGSEYNIEAIHQRINGPFANSIRGTLTPKLGLPAGTRVYEVPVTFTQILAMNGGDVMAAIQSDFLLAIRNPGGISASYYDLQNPCEFLIHSKY